MLMRLGLLAAFLIVAFILYDANALGHVDRYEALRRYVLFNDDWGTHRGYNWRLLLTHIGKFSFFKKF